MIKGSCLCGDITYYCATNPDPNSAGACHCSQCRKQSGHYWAAASLPADQLTIDGAVSWYAASPDAQRGFCARCGSYLFWKGQGRDVIDIALGSVDGPTGVKLSKHIFVADKGDYYDIADGLPQRDQ